MVKKFQEEEVALAKAPRPGKCQVSSEKGRRLLGVLQAGQGSWRGFRVKGRAGHRVLRRDAAQQDLVNI